MMYGDKETFWIGFLLAGDESFAFHNGSTGAMGVATRVSSSSPSSTSPSSDAPPPVPDPTDTDPDAATYRICAAQLLHLDAAGAPLWFNGWIEENKFAEGSSRRVAAFDSYLVEPPLDLPPSPSPRAHPHSPPPSPSASSSSPHNGDDEDKEEDENEDDAVAAVDDAPWYMAESNVCCLTAGARELSRFSADERRVLDMIVEGARAVGALGPGTSDDDDGVAGSVMG
ncbi:hypothetical protein GGR56DRAFT_635969 [Xylariaceae sp. FL0804]|nr:hypothetical protein GGR56DRAFT_635969 [Xylariaceae sp. FL0804]